MKIAHLKLLNVIFIKQYEIRFISNKYSLIQFLIRNKIISPYYFHFRATYREVLI